jgi:tetratricopeptide (TPR) repeat protein
MEAALVKHTEAVDLAEAILQHEPRHDVGRARAYNAHGSRAEAYQRLGRWADAVKDWDRVIELEDHPERWIPRVFRATALARSSDHARAASEAQYLTKRADVSPDGLWELGKTYAICVEAAHTDARLSSTERDSLTEHYALSAIALLQKLQKEGYFWDPAHDRFLDMDPDLKPLRCREDFKKLKME